MQMEGCKRSAPPRRQAGCASSARVPAARKARRCASTLRVGPISCRSRSCAKHTHAMVCLVLSETATVRQHLIVSPGTSRASTHGRIHPSLCSRANSTRYPAAHVFLVHATERHLVLDDVVLAADADDVLQRFEGGFGVGQPPPLDQQLLPALGRVRLVCKHALHLQGNINHITGDAASVCASAPWELQLQVHQCVVNNAVDVPQQRSGGLLPHLLLSLPRGASSVTHTTPETLACIQPLACMCRR